MSTERFKRSLEKDDDPIDEDRLDNHNDFESNNKKIKVEDNVGDLPLTNGLERNGRKKKAKDDATIDDDNQSPDDNLESNNKKMKAVDDPKVIEEWNLGKGYKCRRIARLSIQREQFIDYIRTHKVLSTSNLLDIRGYGNNSSSTN